MSNPVKKVRRNQPMKLRLVLYKTQDKEMAFEISRGNSIQQLFEELYCSNEPTPMIPSQNSPLDVEKFSKEHNMWVPTTIEVNEDY